MPSWKFDAYPSALDTPLKRVAWAVRMWRRLHQWHRFQRNKLPEVLTERQRGLFWAWEREVFVPRLKHLSLAMADANEWAREQGGTLEEIEARLIALRDQYELDNSLDAAGGVEVLQPRGRKMLRKRLHGTEDFTTYTEVDPSSNLTVTSSKVAFATLQRLTNAYVGKDMGADWLTGDFEHLLEVYGDSASGDGSNKEIGGFWSLAVTQLECQYPAAVGNRQQIHFSGFENAGSWRYRVKETYNGANNLGTNVDLSLDTLYYVEFERDTSVGANGTIYGRIYSDASRTTLEGTSTLALSSSETYRYAMASQAWGSSSGTGNSTGYVQNVDVDGGVTPTGTNILPYVVAINNLRRKR